LLDEEICRANITRIAKKAAAQSVSLRPHFKTHQSATVAAWYRAAGVHQCTVSSVAMAEYFAHHDWHDITVAFPVNPLEASVINELAARIHLHICAVNTAGLQLLGQHLQHSVSVWIELDTGYHRTGVHPDDDATIRALLEEIERQPRFRFQGFLAHAGHTYQCRSAQAVRATFQTAEAQLAAVGARYRGRLPELKLSTGDTPGCSLAESFGSVNEIRPGNLVFYDLTQEAIGSCTRTQIALALACPVVAIYPDREEVYVHGGSVHLSKDSLTTTDGTATFGQPVQLTDRSWQFQWPGSFVKSLSQEHGKIHMPREHLRALRVGDVIGIVPVHACLAADAMRKYVSTSGQEIPMMPKP
jgi:D-serine deaminase-like pyridoxal phosphate-dependent protein